MRKKTPKRFELIKWYLLKICDEGHHSQFNLELSDVGFEKIFESLPQGIAPLLESGDAKVVIINEYDNALPNKVRKVTAELIQRDIGLFWAVENIRKKKNISIEKACFEIVEDWPDEIGPYLGEEAVKEIYKFYVGIFRFKKGEDTFLNFPFAEAASYSLRKMKVLRGWYFIDEPVGIYVDIHEMLDIPLEKEIENEIRIYQAVRNKAFGVTFANALGLYNRSMGSFSDRFKNRSGKIINAFNFAVEKFDYDFKKMATIYRHYRLIEAEENGQNQGVIYRRIESDLKDVVSLPANSNL